MRRKKERLLIDGRPPTMRSLELFLEAIEHKVITVMISAARMHERNEGLLQRVEVLEKQVRRLQRRTRG